MKIKDFKDKFLKDSWSKEKDAYIEKFGLDRFNVYEHNGLKIKEGYGYNGLTRIYYEGEKRISETQFKNRIKNF